MEEKQNYIKYQVQYPHAWYMDAFLTKSQVWSQIYLNTNTLKIRNTKYKYKYLYQGHFKWKYKYFLILLYFDLSYSVCTKQVTQPPNTSLLFQ